MPGVTLGYMKFILGFDTIAFKKGMSVAEKDLVGLQKKVEKFGKGMADLGKTMSIAVTAPLVAFAAKGIKEAQETADAMGQVEAALGRLGPQAGMSADELAKAANAFESKSLYEADQILRDVTARLLTFGNIAPANFQKAQQAAIDFATAFKVDLTAATDFVAKALNNPLKGIAALESRLSP